MFSGSALLALATQLHASAVATALMIAGFVTVYLNCHALAHYLAGRAVGLRFRGYGVRGTDHPEVYPPGIRQLMQAAPVLRRPLHQGEPRAGEWPREGDLLRRRRDLDRDLLDRLRRHRRRSRHPRRPGPARRDGHPQRDLDDRHHAQPHRRLRQGAPHTAQLTQTHRDRPDQGFGRTPGALCAAMDLMLPMRRACSAPPVATATSVLLAALFRSELCAGKVLLAIAKEGCRNSRDTTERGDDRGRVRSY
jgi:hypothetical protein